MASRKPFAIGPFKLTEYEVTKRKLFLEIGEEEERLLRDAHPHVIQHVGRIVERFYDYLLSYDETRRILSKPGLVERLKKIQTRYFLELTSGHYDLDYFENRLQVGLAHERVGLSPELYLGAYDKYLQIVAEALSLSFGRDYDRYFKTFSALTKVIFLDMSLAIDAYNFSAQERLFQKAAEMERTNEELRKLDAAKRGLTNMIVHDLQNPLAGIRAFLQVLEGKTDGLTREERAGVREALSRCSDLSILILNVLQLSRAEEAKLKLFIEDVNAADVARAATEAFLLMAKQGGRRLVLDAGELPVLLSTDQSLLRRILDNLIRNALRHTPAGTEVAVRVRPGPPPSISVLDNGPGIPPDLQDRIFEPFTSRAIQSGVGTDSGLGLSFCKMAADALGMDLRLETRPGSGACFVVEARALDKIPPAS